MRQRKDLLLHLRFLVLNEPNALPQATVSRPQLLDVRRQGHGLVAEPLARLLEHLQLFVFFHVLKELRRLLLELKQLHLHPQHVVLVGLYEVGLVFLHDSVVNVFY